MNESKDKSDFPCCYGKSFMKKLIFPDIAITVVENSSGHWNRIEKPRQTNYNEQSGTDETA